MNSLVVSIIRSTVPVLQSSHIWVASNYAFYLIDLNDIPATLLWIDVGTLVPSVLTQVHLERLFRALSFKCLVIAGLKRTLARLDSSEILRVFVWNLPVLHNSNALCFRYWKRLQEAFTLLPAFGSFAQSLSSVNVLSFLKNSNVTNQVKSVLFQAVSTSNKKIWSRVSFIICLCSLSRWTPKLI
jgi:hypothetical protein